MSKQTAVLGLAFAILLMLPTDCGRFRGTGAKSVFSIQEAQHAARRNPDFGISTRIRGVITYVDVAVGDCVVEDASGSLRILLSKDQPSLQAGELVEASGLIQSGSSPLMIEPNIAKIGTAALPDAINVSLESANLASYLDRRISIEGIIESTPTERTGVFAVHIRSGGAVAIVRAGTKAGYALPIDAPVRVTGVLVGLADSGGHEFRLWSRDLIDIEVLRPAPLPQSLRPATVESLLALSPIHVPEHRVRVRGDLEISPSEQIVREKGSAIAVRFTPTAQPVAGPARDLVGFLTIENGAPLLDDVEEVSAAQLPRAGFRTVRDVHQLSAKVAALRLPVRLTAVVTYSDPASGRLFVQDATDGVYVSLRSPMEVPLRSGDLVRIDGGTAPGEFAPIITDGLVTIVGRSPLPHPETDFESAFGGYQDCRWIEVGGVIQDVVTGEFDTAADVVLGDHRFLIHVRAPVEKVRVLIDHEVKVRGVIGGIFNGQRQILGVQLFVPGIEFVQDVSRAGPDPWVAPSRTLASLLQFAPGEHMGHRVRVTGVVTLTNPRGPTSLRDHTGALLIASHELAEVAPGDLVDVVGFAQAGNVGPEMRNASIRKLRSGFTLNPISIAPVEAMTGAYQSQLVRMEGSVVSVSLASTGLSLKVRSGAYIFGAHLPLAAGASNLQALSSVGPGAQVLVTGICSMIIDRSTEARVLRGFDLSLRSLSDVQVIKGRPWLTQARLLMGLAGAGGLVLAAVFWILLLRRSVRRKTSSLAQAHVETIEALRRAREAESLEQSRKAVLEMVARDEPLERILSALATAAVSQIPGAASFIELTMPDGSRLTESHALPPEIERAMLALDTDCMRQATIPLPVAGFAGAIPEYRTAPVVRGGRVIGTIVTLSPPGAVPDGESGNLVSWANLASLAAERRGLYEQLSFRARHDPLTSLYNRDALYESLHNEMLRSARDGSHTAVLYFDLDKFKQINDSYGHDAGDAVLIEVGHRIRRNIRRTDIAARLGGDEFAAVLPALQGRDEAVRIGALIASAIQEPYEWANRQLRIDTSLGISLFPDDATSADELMKAADREMYQAKLNPVDFARR